MIISLLFYNGYILNKSINNQSIWKRTISNDIFASIELYFGCKQSFKQLDILAQANDEWGS